ncbi:MAG TPA: DUF937 domain-containing protein [Propionibacterium sp.]|nr:DUF937 domain-containing protein [Propionibacterium sp.]
MAAVDDIKSTLDMSQIAQFLGTDEQTASATVDRALNQLVGAMDNNVNDVDGAVGLTRAALTDHAQSSAYGDSVDINNVDAADGEKIVSHVFSPNQIQQFGGSGAGGNLLRRLLPLLAPIVMGYLASKLQEKMGGGGRAQAPAPQQGGGLGDILGDLLGGGVQGQTSGGGLGDILGDLLGGGGAAPQQRTQAPSSGATGGFQAPASDGGLRMDPGSSQTAPRTPQAPAGGGAGDLLGGLLKDILIGRR